MEPIDDAGDEAVRDGILATLAVVASMSVVMRSMLWRMASEGVDHSAARLDDVGDPPFEVRRLPLRRHPTV